VTPPVTEPVVLVVQSTTGKTPTRSNNELFVARQEAERMAREAKAARDTQIARIISSGSHLGPMADLTKLLGSPDLVENLGSRLWYGDYVFTVADGLVLAGSRVNPASPAPAGH
jgi:hypothetical protein